MTGTDSREAGVSKDRRRASERVKEFHRAFGHPIRDEPTVPSEEERDLRVKLLVEELEEYVEASDNGDIIGVADALADLKYVLEGAALHWGINLDAVFAEVHRSNMTKLGPDGKPVFREDGKVLKGEGWEPPRIARVLGIPDKARTLIVSTIHSKCGNCGKGADPMEKSHQTVVDWDPEVSSQPGCGTAWEYIFSAYGAAAREGVRRMRPDLALIDRGVVL